MSFPRYPAYKPSGVEWLGVVPEHWSMKQLKHCIHRLGSGGTPESGNPDYWADDESDDSIPWVAIGDMSSASVVYSTAKSLTQAGITEKNLEIFPAGSLLYSIYASLGKVSILGVDAAFNQAILAIISNSDLVSQSFLKYWLENIEKHLSYYSSSNTQANLNAAKVLAYPVAVPHPDEQARIATFLDRETTKIDALIAEQQRLIELLQEKRQAVISHAVTKGLNPDAPMKDSGVEWLGEVPEHWEVGQIRRYIQKERKITYGIVQPGEPDPTGRFMVRGQDYSTGWSNPDSIFRVSPIIEEPYSRSRLKPGDLVMTIVGAGVGNTAKVPDWLGGANVTQTTCRIAVEAQKMNPDYMKLVLDSSVGRYSVGFYAKGAAQPGLNLEHVKVFPVTRPPLDEQEGITEYLKESLSGIDDLIQQSQMTSTLLQERRSALISAAVTGQIDVRGLATEEAA